MLTKIRTTAVALIAAIGIAASLPTADAQAQPMANVNCTKAAGNYWYYAEGAHSAFQYGGWAWNDRLGQNWSYDQWTESARSAQRFYDRYC